MLVFTIEGYQKCNYCNVYADDGGLINDLFACHNCLDTREDKDKMMKSIFNTIINNYKANSGRYITYYENKEEVINDYKEMDRDISEFEYKFGFKLKEIKFPVIAFDEENSPDCGTLLDSTNDRYKIMFEANNYFELLNDEGVWEFDNYTVFEETDLLRFEDSEYTVLGYVVLEDDAHTTINNAEKLNKGYDPIAEKWEDGIGNTISLSGWGEFEKQ